ncbi:MAG: site-specific integrase [Pseudomonadota bacterium]
MSIYLRGKTYWLRITTPGGERVRKSTQTTDRRKAQEYHDKLKAELWRVYKLGEKPRRTWQEAALRWLDEKEHKADLKHDIEKLRWLDSHFGQLYLDEISRDLIDEVASEKKKGKAAATANRYLALIRSILRAARDDWEWVQQIPRVRLFKEPQKRVRWITHDEARSLIGELPQHLADMATFTLATGLRRSNVTGLRWDQVDLGRCLAWIHPDQSKSRKAVSVPLNRDAISILESRIGIDPKYVFTYQGKPVFQTSTKAWYAGLQRAGITDFRWHDLRHTWASWHVQAGTSLQELMELGGWASYQMVLRYAHLGSNQLSNAARRIEKP